MMDMNNASKEEQIGFHKGALSTLYKEREELSKIVNIVDQIMQAHIGALKELGVESKQEAKPQLKKKPVEDIL